MQQNTGDTADAQIESTLVFDTDERYPDDPTLSLIAEGTHERGDRLVRVEFAHYENEYGDHELWETRYYVYNGERKNESVLSHELSETGDGYVVEQNGQPINEFITDSFNTNPRVALTETFDDMM